MRQVVLALFLVLSVAISSYFILLALSVENSIARAVAGIFILTIPFVHGAIKEGSIRISFTAIPRFVVDDDKYYLPIEQIVLYASSFSISIMIVAQGLIALNSIAILYAFPIALLPESVMLLLILVSALVSFFVSTWIGVRCRGNVYLAMIIMSGATVLITLLVIFAVTSESQFKELYGITKNPLSFFLMLLVEIVLWIGFGAVGVWRGTKSTFSTYMSYLMKQLSREKQIKIIKMAQVIANE